MAETIVDAGAKPNSADEAVKASAEATAKAAADKAIADKAAADKATTDAAALANQTPEQKAAAEKAAQDKAAADAAELANRTYDLKVPDGSKLDAAFVERTAAIARELGLDQKGAEKLLTQRAKEHTDAIATASAAWQPPDKDGLNAGPAWIAQETTFRKMALADKTLAPDGTEASLKLTAEHAWQGLKAIDKTGAMGKLLKETGYGSHPAVLAALAYVGRQTKEGGQIVGGQPGNTKLSDSQKLYPDMYNDDGSPKT